MTGNGTGFGLDNWGGRARFGVLIVGDDHVPEPEWWAMAPAGVSIHAARVASGGFRWLDGDDTIDSASANASDVVRGARLFGTMRLDAVCLGHSSSSFIGGYGWDERAAARLGQLTNGIPVTTNGLDCLAALRAVGSRRPFLILPPWYTDGVVNNALEYLARWDVTLAGHHRLDPGRGWQHLTPGETYQQGLNGLQDPALLYQQVRRHCPDSADAVLVVGTGFRAATTIAPLEEDLGRPVITANQASLWHCLRIAGIGSPVSGWGRLFGLSVAAPDRG